MPLQEQQYFDKSSVSPGDIQGSNSFLEAMGEYAQDPQSALEDMFKAFSTDPVAIQNLEKAKETRKEKMALEQTAPVEPTNLLRQAPSTPVPNPNAMPATHPQQIIPRQAPLPSYGSPMPDFNKAIQMSEDIAAKEAKIRQSYADQRIEQSKLNQQNAQNIRKKFGDEFKKYTTELDKISEDLKTQKVDPGRLWKEGSGWGKALMAIGLAIGVKGTPQQMQGSINIMQKAIDQDIELQKDDINRMGNRRGEVRSMMALARQKFGDDITAENATRLLMMGQLNDALDSQLAKLKAPEAKRNGLLLKAKMKQELQKTMQKQAGGLQQMAERSAFLQSKDPAFRMIGASNLPEKSRMKAIEEVGVRRQLEEAVEKIANTYDQFKGDLLERAGGSFSSMFPTEAAAKTQAAGSEIETLLVENWKGPMRDEEYARVVKPLLPKHGVTMTKERLDIFKKALINLLVRNRKPTPYIEGANFVGPIDDVVNKYTGSGKTFGTKVRK